VPSSSRADQPISNQVGAQLQKVPVSQIPKLRHLGAFLFFRTQMVRDVEKFLLLIEVRPPTLGKQGVGTGFAVYQTSARYREHQTTL